MAERKVPRIRFKGFEEDWEQRKLGEMIEVCSGMDYKHLSPGPIPVYGTGGYMLSVDKALSYEKSAVGIGRKGTIDKPYMLEAPFWTVDTLFYCIPREGNNLDFIFDVFQIVDWKQKDESTGVPSLSKVAINETEVNSPLVDEQQKVGEFFDHIDSLLSLHQRKLEKLKILKKALLEKMFPKNGAKVPEIRFSGFTDDWEQRKLGEMAVISTGYPFNSNEFSPEGKYLVITNGNIQDSSTNVDESVGNRITLLDRKILDSYILDIGDILITMDGTVGRTAKVAGNGLILAQRVGRVKPIGNTEFMYQALSTGDFSKAMTELSHGGTIKHISLNEISLFEFKSPVREREQNTVGKLLYLFDTLLSLHQRKLEKLRQIKKSMLERMFV